LASYRAIHESGSTKIVTKIIKEKLAKRITFGGVSFVV
jgi:hypothetical protein